MQLEMYLPLGVDTLKIWVDAAAYLHRHRLDVFTLRNMSRCSLVSIVTLWLGCIYLKNKGRCNVKNYKNDRRKANYSKSK